MLRQALILSSHREYAQTMRSGLLQADDQRLVNIETDPLRAMQLTSVHYDLILLDATLELMDGLQLLQFIKNQAPATKFVVVSDNSDESSRAVAYQNGADFFLERPRTPDAFSVALQAIDGLFKSGSITEALPEDQGDPPVNIIDIVQMHCLSGDSILLLVRGTQQSGDIFIFRGEVYHAQYPAAAAKTLFATSSAGTTAAYVSSRSSLPRRRRVPSRRRTASFSGRSTRPRTSRLRLSRRAATCSPSRRKPGPTPRNWP